jgi:spore coat polysaccharide biosynthesis predicted glycosyltransferase SpsG
MNGIRLIIHANATPAIGAGHAMRCATLADAWTRGGFGPVHLIGKITLPFAEQRLRAVGVEMAADIRSSPSDVVIVDSYAPHDRDVLRTADASLRVLIDDVGGLVPSGTDVIWNPNPYGDAVRYSGFSGRVLTGAECVPIRRGLPVWSPDHRGTAIAIGGSVPNFGVQKTLIAALSDEHCLPVVAVGAWIPSAWRSASVTAPWSDLVATSRAIVGAGTSAWEAAAIGIPATVVCIAENQRLSFDWIRRSGAATVDLSGSLSASTSDRLRRAISDARPLVPLESGADSVASTLRSFVRDGRS